MMQGNVKEFDYEMEYKKLLVKNERLIELVKPIIFMMQKSLPIANKLASDI